MKRRRLASVEVEIARIDGAAPTSFEVIREHAATGRVQLAAWTVPTEEAADKLAASLNAQVEHAGGVTLASSGLLERGWIYRPRKAS